MEGYKTTPQVLVSLKTMVKILIKKKEVLLPNRKILVTSFYSILRRNNT